MERFHDISGVSPSALSAAEAEELFRKVDNSGHTDEESAERQRRHRKEYGHGVDVDPLSLDDPSGSNIGKVITRVAIALMVAFVGMIIVVQVYVGYARGKNTANLSGNANVRTVADALAGGVEWGNGFTQFPAIFSVQEADQNTGHIEVTVVDTTSANALVCFSDSQIQATAFSATSLLNPHIDTVIYHVKVHMDDEGHMQRQSLFGYLRPTGDLTPFMTFIWSKNTSRDGQIRFTCTITGVDAELQDTLRSQILNVPPDTEVEFETNGQELNTRTGERESTSSSS